MAKSNKKTTKAVTKKAANTKSSEAIKSIAAKAEAKKITSAPEKKKITAKPEVKKLAVTKEMDKIAAKPEPKKIKSVEPIKIAEKKDTKKAPKTTKAKAKKVVKMEKKENSTAKKVVKKETDKKTSAQKADVKTKKQKATTKTEKKATKKTAPKSKQETYASLNLEECINLMQLLGIMHAYEDYREILLDEADLKVIEKNMIDGNNLADKKFDFDKDGYDLDLITITLEKVADTMDVKAADFKEIKKEMNASLKTTMGKDDEKNAKEYLKEFKLAEKILMIGQRKNINDSKVESKRIGSDIDAFMDHFFTLAYAILPTWQYDDVKFYEDFAYAILSQFNDLYEKQQLRIQLDCADLYIKHGDFQHGDENYGYILRDNQIKDYIYYRFASVYEDIDLNKAKGLAYESMQYVDDRYTYYPNILEIMNK